MKNINKYKDVLFDELAKCTGVGIGDNKIYYCYEIYCEDCKFYDDCNHSTGTDSVLKMHQWINKNFESQNEDIMDYLCDCFAIHLPDNEFTRCGKMPVCATCFFNHYKEEMSCTKGKRIWLNEEVQSN